MSAQPISVEAMQISADGLDDIHVFWVNLSPGVGSVTITCYGCAWTCWFGAMRGQTIQQFFAEVDSYYLWTKLGITPALKQRKSDQQYLTRIIEAVQQALVLPVEAAQ